MGHFALLTPFRGLEAAYDLHLGLIRKRVVDFLLAIIELFFAIGLRAEALRANINRKWPFLMPPDQFAPKFSGRRGRPPPTILRVRKLDEFPFHVV